MKFQIGQPVQVSDGRGKWKGYICWHYPERNEYLLSCAGYPTMSHTHRAHEDDIEERKMPKSELKTQKKFREYADQLWADRKKFERGHSCKGCPMLPEVDKNWKDSAYLGNACCVAGIRCSHIDIYPFRKTRCLVRPKNKEEAKILREKVIENRKRKINRRIPRER